MKRAVVGALLISLVAASAAMAGPPSSHPRDHGNRHVQRHYDHRHDVRQDRRHDRRDDRRYDRHHNDFRGKHYHAPPSYRFERGRYHWGAYHRPPGYAHRHWVRGDRLPRAYYGPTYVVHNYSACGLRRPPHGHHWVRVNNDVVLAAVATGVVLDVVFNRFW